jgi:hypothetical protein
MWSRSTALYAICLGYAAVGGAHPVAALTIEECSAKYRAANSETGRIITWQQFRRDNCGASAGRSSATAAAKAHRSMGFNPGPGSQRRKSSKRLRHLGGRGPQTGESGRTAR